MTKLQKLPSTSHWGLFLAWTVVTNYCPTLAQEAFFVGSLRTRDHDVQGDVYVLGERVLEIRDFTYDGRAPFAYFWADADKEEITSNGIVLADGFPSNNCAISTADRALGRFEDVPAQRVEFPEGTSILDFLGGSISVWCERFEVNFGEVRIPDDLSLDDIPSVGPPIQCSEGPRPPEEELAPGEVPPIAMTPDGFNCEPLNDDYQVRWRINGDQLDVELVGDIPDGAYMGFGVSGSPDSTMMIGADAIVADIPISGIGPRARDYTLGAQAQCNGVTGVCPQEGSLSSDLTSISGEKSFGLTRVKYTRPLVPSGVASGLDRIISAVPGIETYIVWALGPVNPQTENPNFHSIDYAEEDVSLEFGRAVVDNCEPLIVGGTAPPTPAPVIPFRRNPVGNFQTNINAQIGPAGGPRGYTTITGGLVSWGIAWWLNGMLIPEVIMQRGRTYTFRINGGTDPSDGANYHPFYLTTSSTGGYSQLSPEERLEETPLAGVTITERDPITGGVIGFTLDAAGPICRYRETDATTSEAELSIFRNYAATLENTCPPGSEELREPGILRFTPDETTPDVIFYQCATHTNLGYRIRVIDNIPLPGFPSPAPVSSPTGAPGSVACNICGEGAFMAFPRALLTNPDNTQSTCLEIQEAHSFIPQDQCDIFPTFVAETCGCAIPGVGLISTAAPFEPPTAAPVAPTTAPVAPTNPPVPPALGIAQTPPGYNCEPLSDDFQVRWRINGDDIDIELVGDIPDGAYMGFGVSGSTSFTFMTGADVVLADMVDGPRATDYSIDARRPCTTGGVGVCPDEDDSDVTAVSGEQDLGLTLVRYTRPLIPSGVGSTTTNGQPVDRPIPVESGAETFIVWALGFLAADTDLPMFHSLGYPRQNVSLEFGRPVADNCEALA